MLENTGGSMKHLREFIYDKSDVLVALVILLIAALVIFWRFEAIADYPSTLVGNEKVKSASESSEISKSKDKAKNSDSKATKSKKDDSDSDASKDDKGDSSSKIYRDGATKEEANVSVQSGSAIEATESLVSLGYFKSYDDFVETCNASGIDPNSIKAGNFSIPAGSTKADIARIVCQ